jgi:hypothetical protein
MEFLVWLEQLSFSTWVRESNSLLAYPSFLTLHTLGLAFLVGINAAIDLRILGFAPRMPLAPMEKLFPVMVAGFWVNAVSGLVLTMADATTKLINPVFYIKMGFIALAVVNIQLLRVYVFRDPSLDKHPVLMKGRILACTSLVFWTGAITAGRLTAYLGPVSGLQ